jgi:hypothetical protein
LLSSSSLFAQTTVVCWYDARERLIGSSADVPSPIGVITRGGSSYVISAFDGQTCPSSIWAGATRGVTTYPVKQDFSSCTNDDVRATPSNVGGSATVFHEQTGGATVVVRLTRATPNTTYHFFPQMRGKARRHQNGRPLRRKRGVHIVRPEWSADRLRHVFRGSACG